MNLRQGIPSTIEVGVNVATKAIIPGEVLLTGNISSAGKLVTGVGTLFSSELFYMPNGNVLKYKYLWDSTGNRLMEIDYVVNDLQLWLKVDLGNIAAQTLKVADSGKAYRDCEIMGGVTVSAPNQDAVVYPNTDKYEQHSEGGLAPIAIVATGATKINLTV